MGRPFAQASGCRWYRASLYAVEPTDRPMCRGIYPAPAGYHWETAPTPAQVVAADVSGDIQQEAPSSNTAAASAVPAWNTLTPDPQAPAPAPSDTGAQALQWHADVVAMFRAHPALNYQHNATILQEKLNNGPVAGLSNAQLLTNAFYAAEADSRWSNGP